jgi:hypothetical protein
MDLSEWATTHSELSLNATASVRINPAATTSHRRAFCVKLTVSVTAPARTFLKLEMASLHHRCRSGDRLE